MSTLTLESNQRLGAGWAGGVTPWGKELDFKMIFPQLGFAWGVLTFFSRSFTVNLTPDELPPLTRST